MTEERGEDEADDGALDGESPDPAAAAPGLVEAVLVPPKGLVPTLLVLMLAVAGWAIFMPAPLQPLARPDLALISWQEGATSLAQRRDALLRASPALPDEAAIAGEFALWLAREATQGTAAIARDAAARRQLAGLEERVRRFGLTHGGDNVVAAATRWGVRVRRAFEADLRTPGASTALDRVAPGLYRSLTRAGIAGLRQEDGALVPAAALVVESLAMQRYLALGRRLPAPRPELGSPLAILLMRFRVEAHGGLDLGRRLRLAETLAERDPAWPSTWVTAVLMARSGRYRAAQAWFERAATLGEHPDAARQNARWCRQQLRLATRG